MGSNSRAASSTILGLSKCWLHLKTRARSESRRTYFMGTYYKTKKRAQNILPSLYSLLMISKQGRTRFDVLVHHGVRQRFSSLREKASILYYVPHILRFHASINTFNYVLSFLDLSYIGCSRGSLDS